jgi:hypothetical protein
MPVCVVYDRSMVPALCLSWLSPALAAPPDDATWEVLSTAPVHVECTVSGGEPWCRSRAIVKAPVNGVASALEGLGSRSETFTSVRSIAQVAPDTLHVVLDFPGMLADRDYVVRYTSSVDGQTRRYRWEPVEHPAAPPLDGVVRLSHMAGEWELGPDPDGTRVSYTWQADLGGSFPAWAEPIARRRAGFEVLRDLASAGKAELSPP